MTILVHSLYDAPPLPLRFTFVITMLPPFLPESVPPIHKFMSALRSVSVASVLLVPSTTLLMHWQL